MHLYIHRYMYVYIYIYIIWIISATKICTKDLHVYIRQRNLIKDIPPVRFWKITPPPFYFSKLKLKWKNISSFFQCLLHRMYFQLSSGIKRIKRFETNIAVRKFTSSFSNVSEGFPFFYRFQNAARALS